MSEASGVYHKDFVICPWCGHRTDSVVSHLYADALPRSFGPWYCDACLKAFRGSVNAPGDVSIIRDSTATTSSRSMALLKLHGVDGPVFFVMDHDRYWSPDGRNSDEENQEHQRFLFEQHSCPTNWLRECVAVIKGGDCDPHGFLEFVRVADVPQDFDEHDDEQWPMLFPEAFGGSVIDGVVTETPLMLTIKEIETKAGRDEA